MLNKYNNINKEFLRQDKYITKKKTLMMVFSQFIEQIAGYISVLFIIWSAFMGKILMGSTVGLIRAVSLVQSNVKSFVTTTFNMYENNLFIEQLFEFLDVPLSSIDTDRNDRENIDNIDTIEFKNLYFKYPSREEYTLKNIH